MSGLREDVQVRPPQIHRVFQLCPAVRGALRVSLAPAPWGCPRLRARGPIRAAGARRVGASQWSSQESPVTCGRDSEENWRSEPVRGVGDHSPPVPPVRMKSWGPGSRLLTGRFSLLPPPPNPFSPLFCTAQRRRKLSALRYLPSREDRARGWRPAFSFFRRK